MNGWTNRLYKAIQVANHIEHGTTEKTPFETEDERRIDSVKHYTLYSIVGLTEKPIAWRLYASDLEYITAAARKRMLRAYESIVEGDPLYVATRFEAREDK